MQVFDVTRKITYKNLQHWYSELRQNRTDIPCILVGNKIDGEFSQHLGAIRYTRVVANTSQVTVMRHCATFYTIAVISYSLHNFRHSMFIQLRVALNVASLQPLQHYDVRSM